MANRIKTTLVAIALVVAIPASAGATEICGDGVDNDSDSLADEGCMPSTTTGVCENPLDCGNTGAVAPKTGALNYQLPADLAAIVAYGPPLSFSRSYTSMYAPGGSAPAYRKPMGERWQHPYMSWLDKSGSTAVVHSPAGQDVLYTYSSTVSGYDYYSPQAGFHVQYLRQSTSSPFKWELKDLDGNVLVYDWSSPTGKLIEIWDTLATPNKVLIAYDGNGEVSTVTSADTSRRLLFTYSGTPLLLASVALQRDSGGGFTSQVTASYTYTSGYLTAFVMDGKNYQEYTYTNNYLTKVADNSHNAVYQVAYLSATAGKVASVKTDQGTMGFEYSSGRASCSGGTVVGFNQKQTLPVTCYADSDCGGGYVCAGVVTPATSPGQCYAAARCLTITSPNEDLVTTVTPVAASGDTCEGACTEAAEYSWDTSLLNLLGLRHPLK